MAPQRAPELTSTGRVSVDLCNPFHVCMAGMEEDNSVSFTTPEEEMEYWKEKAMEYRTKYV